MKEKILSASLAALLLVGSINPVAYAQNGLNNKAKVEKLVNRKIVEGDEKGNLNLNDNIKRSEITKIIVYALGKEAEAKKLQPKQGKFSDVSINHWANGVISYASEEKMKNGQNIVNGYPDGTFKPEDNITNAELLKMLVVATKKDLNSTEIKNAQWPKDYIKWAEEEKIIGKDTGIEKIEPSEKATRETAFVALSNGLEKIEKKTNTSTNKEEPKKTEDKNRSGFNYRTINIVGYDAPRDNRSSNTDSRPAKPLNPTKPVTPKNPAAPLVPSPKEDVKYADGTWYGIAKENYANPQRGEDLVAVTIKDGKITGAKIVYTTEDSAVGSKEINGKRILGVYFGENGETFKTPKNIDEKGLKKAQEDLNRKYKEEEYDGDKYDAVTNATVSARAYLLGVEHALQRAAKYAKDKEDQKIAFIKVEDRTNAMNEGKLFYNQPIDLSFLKFEVTKANGEILEHQTLDDLKNLGVKCNYKNGDVIPLKEKNTKIELNLKHEVSLTNQSLKITVSKVPEVKEKPTHFLITFNDETTQIVNIPGEGFVAKAEVKKVIKKVELYKDKKNIAEANLLQQYANTSRYQVETGKLESKDRWEYGTYRLDTHFGKKMEVESFKVLPITTEYGTGETLGAKDLKLEVIMNSGEKKTIFFTDAPKGFTIDPKIGYEFNEEDLAKKTKEITVKYKEESQKYTVKIIKQDNLIPSKVVIKDKKDNTEIFKLNIDQKEWTEKNGMIIKSLIGSIPTKYETVKISDFDIKVYNSEDKEIKILDTKKTTYAKTPSNQGFFQVYFKTKDEDVNNYAMWRVEFKDVITDKVPTKVVLKDKKDNTVVKEFTWDKEKFEESSGTISMSKQSIPAKYKDLEKNTFKIEVFNESNQAIDDIVEEVKVVNAGKMKNLTINFKTDKYDASYLMIFFTEFEGEENSKKTISAGEYFGEALCKDVDADFSFTQKVKVLVGDNGRIKEVTDDNTDRGKGNKPYWMMYISGDGLKKYNGKDLDGVKAMKTGTDELDSVSGATVTSQSVQQAVIKALESKNQNK